MFTGAENLWSWTTSNFVQEYNRERLYVCVTIFKCLAGVGDREVDL